MFNAPAERAEEIYHRMWRGDSAANLGPRWMPDAASLLEDALDEFQTVAPNDDARIWLAEKLGRELPVEVRQCANQRAWERDAERKARTLMSDGRLDEALRAINERPLEARTDTSPLWLIEIDIRVLRGASESALEIINLALARLQRAIDPDQTFALLTRRAAVEERLGRLETARQTITEAFSLAMTMHNSVNVFACGITLLRLARKAGHLADPEIKELQSLLALACREDQVRRALAERPSLLRESAAELGTLVPELLADAVERLGVETYTMRNSSMVTLDLDAALSSAEIFSNVNTTSQSSTHEVEANPREIGTAIAKGSGPPTRARLPQEARGSVRANG
jgi:tetratricopeptide (TPR) repeat protein